MSGKWVYKEGEMKFSDIFDIEKMDREELIGLLNQMEGALRQFVEVTRDETCKDCNEKIGKYIASKVMGIFEYSAKKAKQAKNN